MAACLKGTQPDGVSIDAGDIYFVKVMCKAVITYRITYRIANKMTNFGGL
jgi:hypothetical protein